MDEGLALASAASLLADPTRAELLMVMMDGRAFPVSDLAGYAHVSVSTASHHLSKLVDGGLIQVVQQGRHRYHRIANDGVASLIEALGVATPQSSPPLNPTQRSLRYCRTCYSHLAGQIGVQLRQALESGSFLEASADRYVLTESGSAALRELGIENGPKLFGKTCIDWTERVPHIGGPLGKALFLGFIDLGWAERTDLPRQIRLTRLGEIRFREVFEIKVDRKDIA